MKGFSVYTDKQGRLIVPKEALQCQHDALLQQKIVSLTKPSEDKGNETLKAALSVRVLPDGQFFECQADSMLLTPAKHMRTLPIPVLIPVSLNSRLGHSRISQGGASKCCAKIPHWMTPLPRRTPLPPFPLLCFDAKPVKLMPGLKSC